jgi:hypothetical protein
MANCHVLEADQKPTDRPSKRIKRSGGHSLVRKGLAYWLKENVLLQMLPEREYVAPPDNSTLIYEYQGGPIMRWEWRGKIDRLPVRDWKENLLLSYPIADQRSHPAY